MHLPYSPGYRLTASGEKPYILHDRQKQGSAGISALRESPYALKHNPLGMPTAMVLKESLTSGERHRPGSDKKGDRCIGPIAGFLSSSF
jgi:hypothetical protein